MIIRVIAATELCRRAGYRQGTDVNEIRIVMRELTGERKKERHAAVVREEE